MEEWLREGRKKRKEGEGLILSCFPTQMYSIHMTCVPCTKLMLVPSKERVAKVPHWLCVCLSTRVSQQTGNVGMCVLLIQVELLQTGEDRGAGGRGGGGGGGGGEGEGRGGGGKGEREREREGGEGVGGGRGRGSGRGEGERAGGKGGKGEGGERGRGGRIDFYCNL